MNLGKTIDALHALREHKRALEAELKDVRQEIEEAEQNVMEMLKQNGVTMSAGEHATVSITETVVPAVEDWDAFYEHIMQTGDFHLLERRPASRAYRELLESGEDVPGLRPFTKRNLSLRSK